eukprot:Lithocolla_globosa_v1_NODE_4061_length_1515_cov_10.713115.p1 type:complete len:299 gc:universal NODE_4061_length_1515_cov_10.713115:1471-575(-)
MLTRSLLRRFASMTYNTRQIGAPHTAEYALYFEKEGVPISPFHDIPLFSEESEKVYNMVVEIPRWTNAKLEVSKNKAFNPICQDTKKGQLRFVKNCFPHKGYIWNYGCLPQTWEDPTHTDADTNCSGDNDPIDVCEIGSVVAAVGEVKQVKVLGVMAMIDEGETDWKVIAIDVKDPLAAELKDIEDVERFMPGFINATEEWFRIYKMPDGKPENKFAFDGEAKNAEYAHKVIAQTNESWKKLIASKEPTIQCTNTQVEDSPHHVGADSSAVQGVPAAAPLPAASLDSSVDKWHFVATL